MALRKFIIERDIPKVGSLERDQLRAAAAKSNGVLHQLGPDIQWVESYVADDKTFCVYLAKDEAIIRKHAEISGFPCDQDHRSTKNDRSYDGGMNWHLGAGRPRGAALSPRQMHSVTRGRRSSIGHLLTLPTSRVSRAPYSPH